MTIFFIIFFTLYFLVHFYLFRRLKRISAFLPRPVAVTLYVLFFFFSGSYIFARSLLRGWDYPLYDAVLNAGALWFAILLYTILGLLLSGLLRRFIKHTAYYKDVIIPAYSKYARLNLYALALFVCGWVGYGYYNANNLQVTRFEVTLPKKMGAGQPLSLLFFSDSHFTPIMDASLAKKIADISIELKPDAIVMAGDVVDDQNHHLRRHGIAAEVKQFRSRYGVFAAPGNHEYIAGIDSALSYLRESGITVLRDSGTVLANTLRLIGRDDSSKFRSSGVHRLPLGALVNKQDTLPVLLLDHQPFKLKDVAQSGVNLQLSGHTHNGQMFPFNLVTNLIYEVSYGYKQIGDFGIYVSSGAGTWGPPVRTGSPAEVVYLKINFR